MRSYPNSQNTDLGVLGPPSNAGIWALTLWTADRSPVLVGLSAAGVGLSQLGSIVETRWAALAREFAGVVSDELVILPDRVRGIVHIAPHGPCAVIEPLVGWLKAAVARDARHLAHWRSAAIWEPGFEAVLVSSVEELALWRRRIRATAAALFGTSEEDGRRARARPPL